MTLIHHTNEALEHLADLVTSRRSSLLIQRDLPVAESLLNRLCSLVFHTPNHKRTQPWQVAVFTHDGRLALGGAFRADAIRDASSERIPEAKLDKIESKYARAPAVVVVGCATSEDPLRHRENLFSVAAGVQNLLLGAAAAGLSALWSSPPVVRPDATNRLCGFAPGTEMVAVVYLGWPIGLEPAAAVPREAPQVAWRTER